LRPIDGYEVFAAFWIIHEFPVIGGLGEHVQSCTFDPIFPDELEVCRGDRAPADPADSDEAVARRLNPNEIARLKQAERAAVPRTPTGAARTASSGDVMAADRLAAEVP
jgi:hypothetical protein